MGGLQVGKDVTIEKQAAVVNQVNGAESATRHYDLDIRYSLKCNALSYKILRILQNRVFFSGRSTTTLCFDSFVNKNRIPNKNQ